MFLSGLGNHSPSRFVLVPSIQYVLAMENHKLLLPEYQTKRLLLRKLELSTSLRSFEEFGKQQVFDALGVASPEQDLFARRFYENVAHNERFTAVNWLIYRKGEPRLLGDCGFHLIWRQHHKGELGYTLYREEDWGKGYMREALSHVLPFGFEGLGFERVEAFTAVDNAASLALLRRYGFRREGFARKHYRVGEENTDSFAFGLLREEYEVEAPEMSAAEKLVRGFERQLLTKAAFTHEAHLTVGLWYVYHEGEWNALKKMREGLLAFLQGLGLNGHYHETMTVFWVKALAQFVAEGPKLSFGEMLEALLQSPLADKQFSKQFYSAACLESMQARASYVPPDL
jgi:ribosomal-protein-alanine N-acetyltransferase